MIESTIQLKQISHGIEILASGLAESRDYGAAVRAMSPFSMLCFS